MNPKFSFLQPLSEPRPRVLGAGFFAVDVVIGLAENAQPRLYAGGSCGNVMAILAYLGWNAYPVGRLRNNVAATVIAEDLRRWKVHTNFLRLESKGSTPIVVERIGRSPEGLPYHRFEFRCPSCQAWLPRHTPLPLRFVRGLAGTLPSAQIFYFDRAERSIIELAKECKQHGASIFFEPSSFKDGAMFRECIAIADILKYSDERLGHVEELSSSLTVPLQIETLGPQGLRYRGNGRGQLSTEWQFVPPYRVSEFKDSAGSGDWCSAGILHALHSQSLHRAPKYSHEQVKLAVEFGQALAALNCRYEGARGGMEEVKPKDLPSLIATIQSTGRVASVLREKLHRRNSADCRLGFCQRCEEDLTPSLPAKRVSSSIRSTKFSKQSQAQETGMRPSK